MKGKNKTDGMTEAAASQHVPWLLLMFTLTAKQASERVEVWRKLKKYGTLPLRSSGHLLPNTPENQERFEWIAAAGRLVNRSGAQILKLCNNARRRERFQTIAYNLDRLAA